jgi:hypothetical protein
MVAAVDAWRSIPECDFPEEEGSPPDPVASLAVGGET